MIKRKLTFIVALFFLNIFVFDTYAQIKVINYKSNQTYEKYRSIILGSIQKNNRHSNGSVYLGGAPNLTINPEIQFHIFPIRKVLITDIKKNKKPNEFYCLEPQDFVIIPSESNGRVYTFSLKDSVMGLIVGNRASFYLSSSKQDNAGELSFFYLLEREKYLNNDALVYKDQNLDLIGRNGEFHDISEYLINKYETVEKFMAYVDHDHEDDLVTADAAKNFDLRKDAVSFMKNSWRYRSEFLPTDTTGNIKYLLNDIIQDKIVESHNKGQLVKSIMYILKSPDPAIVSAGDNFSFMRKNIYSAFSEHLNAGQLKKLMHHIRVMDKRFMQVDPYIFKSCLRETYPTPEGQIGVYKNYILSVLNN